MMSILHNNFRRKNLKIQLEEKNEMKECNFKPSINKSFSIKRKLKDKKGSIPSSETTAGTNKSISTKRKSQTNVEGAIQLDHALDSFSNLPLIF